MTERVLSQRALGRATLARQLLLERATMSVADALEHLVGLQAQTANTWYTGLWSRLEGFDPLEASKLLESREAVRIALMRSTIHLVTTRDALRLRPLLQPAVARPLSGRGRTELRERGIDDIAAAGRELFEAGPLTNAALGAALAKQWPAEEPGNLVMAVRVAVPLVQVTPRGLWGQAGAAKHVPLESWVNRTLDESYSAEELVRRYLGAFGPATPADAQAWSGLSRLREVFERLRPELEIFRAEDGRELFDLPDAPRPPEDTPAPVRFLYDFDNLMLSHADRSRFIENELRRRLISDIGSYSYGGLLVDGYAAGIWRIERANDSAALIIKLTRTLVPADKDAVTEEGERLLAFWAADTKTRDVQMTRVADK